MLEVQQDLFGNHVLVPQAVTTVAEACEIPASVAVCPICGAKLWIESIEEVVEEDDGTLLPNIIQIACESEPDPEDVAGGDFEQWMRWHYSTPYIDWLPVEDRVLRWMQEPEQQRRFELIWFADKTPSA